MYNVSIVVLNNLKYTQVSLTFSITIITYMIHVSNTILIQYYLYILDTYIKYYLTTHTTTKN